jgi:hypothetical protein
MPLSTSLRTFLAIARRLRYRTLDHVIGREVLVKSEETAQSDVLESLNRFLPPRLLPRTELAPGLPTVAKHALLDLELELPSRDAADLSRLSRRDLREMGVLTRGGAPEPAEEADACLSMLFDEVTSGVFVLKMILDAIKDDRATGQRLRDTEKGLPKSYLPRKFRVRDACITNGPILWLGKHFYL